MEVTNVRPFGKKHDFFGRYLKLLYQMSTTDTRLLSLRVKQKGHYLPFCLSYLDKMQIYGRYRVS